MGLFSSRTKIYTSAQVYGLGTLDEDYIDPVRGAVLSSVLSNDTDNLAKNISRAAAQSPWMNLRRFYNYVTVNEPDRLFTATLGHNELISQAGVDQITSVLGSSLGLSSTETVRVQYAVIDDAEVDYFAEAWLTENRATVTEDDWEASYDALNDEIDIVRYDSDDLTIESVTIASPADFIWAKTNNNKLLYVFYQVLDQHPVTGQLAVGPLKLFTYRIGSGNVVFDNLQTQDGLTMAAAQFYPVYMLRHENNSIRAAGYEDEYQKAKKAYRRLTGAQIDDLLDEIEDNESIADIDFCYLAQGVTLGTNNPAGKRYLFEFFDSLHDDQDVSKDQFDLWTVLDADEYGQNLNIDQWMDDARDFQNQGKYQHQIDTGVIHPWEWNAPVYPDPPPVQTMTFEPGTTGVGNFKFQLEWRYIDKTLEVGNAAHWDGNSARTKMKKGEVYITEGPTKEIWVRKVDIYRGRDENASSNIPFQKQTVKTILIMRQYDSARYTKLEICDLVHQNWIYKDHKETTQANDSVADPESAFLVPLHHGVLQSIPTRMRSQLTQTVSHLVFNAYVKQKVKWYQRGLFKVLLFIAAIAISMFIGPAGFAAAGGILGTNAALGAALGFSGTAALVAGAAANMVAGLVVSSLIQWGATALFGEKIGAVIGTLAAFLGTQIASTFVQTGTFAVDWSSLFSADKILALTNAVGNAYARWVQFDTMELYEDIEQIGEDHEKRMEDLQDMWSEVLGDDPTQAQAMLLSSVALDYRESSNAFLSRTLLTGSDIAELSNGLIGNFVDSNLDLPKAFV